MEQYNDTFCTTTQTYTPTDCFPAHQSCHQGEKSVNPGCSCIRTYKSAPLFICNLVPSDLHCYFFQLCLSIHQEPLAEFTALELKKDKFFSNGLNAPLAEKSVESAHVFWAERDFTQTNTR